MPKLTKPKYEQSHAPKSTTVLYFNGDLTSVDSVMVVDYEVLGLASDGRHCLMIFCLGLHFFWSVS
jgi:hypothetical protein